MLKDNNIVRLVFVVTILLAGCKSQIDRSEKSYAETSPLINEELLTDKTIPIEENNLNFDYDASASASQVSQLIEKTNQQLIDDGLIPVEESSTGNQGSFALVDKSGCLDWRDTVIQSEATSTFNQMHPEALTEFKKMWNELDILEMVPTTTSSRQRMIFQWDSSLNGGLARCRGNTVYLVFGGLENRSLTTMMHYMMHEMIHGLGYAHEQQRNDRDQYIVRTSAYDSRYESQNDKSSDSVCESGFDFDSQLFNYRNFWTKNPSSSWNGYGNLNKWDRFLLSYADFASLLKRYGADNLKRNLRCYPPTYPVVNVISQKKDDLRIEFIKNNIHSFGVRAWISSTKLTSCVDEDYKTYGSQILWYSNPGRMPGSKTTKMNNSWVKPGGTYYLNICPFGLAGPDRWFPKPLVLILKG